MIFVCITTSFENLTKGKKYEATFRKTDKFPGGIAKTIITITDDMGKKSLWWDEPSFHKRFIALDEWREMNLEDLGI